MKFPSIRCHGNASAFPLYVFVLARLRARALLPRVNLQWHMSHQDASSSPMLDICVLNPHECDEHPCTAAAASALLPVQACLVCRQCPSVRPSVCLSVCLSVWLAGWLAGWLPAWLPVCLMHSSRIEQGWMQSARPVSSMTIRTARYSSRWGWRVEGRGC